MRGMRVASCARLLACTRSLPFRYSSCSELPFCNSSCSELARWKGENLAPWVFGLGWGKTHLLEGISITSLKGIP